MPDFALANITKLLLISPLPMTVDWGKTNLLSIIFMVFRLAEYTLRIIGLFDERCKLRSHRFIADNLKGGMQGAKDFPANSKLWRRR